MKGKTSYRLCMMSIAVKLTTEDALDFIFHFVLLRFICVCGWMCFLVHTLWRKVFLTDFLFHQIYVCFQQFFLCVLWLKWFTLSRKTNSHRRRPRTCNVCQKPVEKGNDKEIFYLKKMKLWDVSWKDINIFVTSVPLSFVFHIHMRI